MDLKVAEKISPVLSLPAQWPWEVVPDLLHAVYVRLRYSADDFSKMEKKEVRELSVRTICWLSEEQFSKIEFDHLNKQQTQNLLDWQKKQLVEAGVVKRFALSQLENYDGKLSKRQKLALIPYMLSGEEEAKHVRDKAAAVFTDADRFRLVEKCVKIQGIDEDIKTKLIEFRMDFDAFKPEEQRQLFSLAAIKENLALAEKIPKLNVDFLKNINGMTLDQELLALKKCPEFVNELKSDDWIKSLEQVVNSNWKSEQWFTSVREKIGRDHPQIQKFLNLIRDDAT